MCDVFRRHNYSTTLQKLINKKWKKYKQFKIEPDAGLQVFFMLKVKLGQKPSVLILKRMKRVLLLPKFSPFIILDPSQSPHPNSLPCFAVCNHSTLVVFVLILYKCLFCYKLSLYNIKTKNQQIWLKKLTIMEEFTITH